MQEFTDVINKYYPSGISFFSGKYEATKEYTLLMDILGKEDTHWNDFIDSCINEFGVSSLDDRTDGEPGHVLLLHIKANEQRYVIVWYVARIINAYCFRVQAISATSKFPDFEGKEPKNWNASPSEIQPFINRLTEIMRTHFPEYIPFENDLDQLVPSISTQVHDLGEATILNLFFTNYSY